jgi:hypothetical protein
MAEFVMLKVPFKRRILLIAGRCNCCSWVTGSKAAEKVRLTETIVVDVEILSE